MLIKSNQRKTQWLVSIFLCLLWWIIPRYIPALALFVLVAGGAWWLWLLICRDAHNKNLFCLIGTAYSIRLFAAFGLFLISYLELPIISSQYHTLAGFWRFAPDAALTHNYAISFLSEGQAGSEFQRLIATGGQDHVFWVLMISGIYKLFGPQPLHAIVTNVWFSTLQVLLAVWIMRRFAEEKQAMRAGWLVALWPSAIMWSTQILKDSLCVALIMLVLATNVMLWRIDRRGSSFLLQASRWLVLIFSLTLLTKFRSYMGTLFLVTAFIVYGTSFILALIRKFYPLLQRSMAMLIAVVASILLANVIQLPKQAAVPRIPKQIAAPQIISSGKQALATMKKGLSLSGAVKTREGFIRESGRSQLTRRFTPSSIADLIRLLPYVFTTAWLAPFPRQWFDIQGTSGVFRVFGGIEMLLFYLLIPFLLCGVWRFIRYYQKNSLFLLVFIILASAAFGLVMPNVGTLFRLRLQFLIPWLMIGSLGFDMRVVKRISKRKCFRFLILMNTAVKKQIKKIFPNRRIK